MTRGPLRRRVTATGLVAAMVVGFLVAVVPAVAPVAAPTAAAATAADWDPGYIIDDSVFYSADGMTAGEVQAFLDGKVRTCASGATCLKSYAQSTDNRPADQYCNGYTGTARETAAQIIDKVARSCGINQRVLLVLLEKEQSLVTSRSPSAWNYSAAMGQGCPDTAPCDPATSGFFYQVYYAARQFEIYRLNPNSFGYRAQRWNNILWHPNTGCGTRSVFINNQATAALYIYTPYTPNQAALNNMYGEGDACSSYGNRNFWRIFTDWFGNPRTYAVHPGFEGYWKERGGADGPMGGPVSYPVYLEANGQGWYQRFQRGVVYGSFTGGTAFVYDNVILAEYLEQGGPAAGMGWPNGEQTCISGVRCMQSFVNATITTTAGYGAHVLWGGLNDYWKGRGGLSGSLGAAVNDVAYRTRGSYPAWVQHFEGGVLAQSPYGIYVVPYGAVANAWNANGGGEAWLGWPSSDHQCEAGGGTCHQRFAGGVITWQEGGVGARVISGGFVSEWDRRGGISGMGAAQNDMRTSSVGGTAWAQTFAAGVLAQSSAGTALVAKGPINDLWTGSGLEKGWLGWPRADVSCLQNERECVQRFQGATVTTSPVWGIHTVFGGLGGAWDAAGGLHTYGVALNDLRYTDAGGGGWIQHYKTGILTQQRSGGVVYSPYGRIIDMWYHYGAERTWLGWPAGAQQCTSEGCVQQFQKGVARSDAAGNVSFLPR